MDSLPSPSQVTASQIQTLMGKEPAPFCIYYAKTSEHGRVDYYSHWKCGTVPKSMEFLWVHVRKTAQRPDSLEQIWRMGETTGGTKLSSFPTLARYQLIPPLQGKHCAKRGRLGQKSC